MLSMLLRLTGQILYPQHCKERDQLRRNSQICVYCSAAHFIFSLIAPSQLEQLYGAAVSRVHDSVIE